MMLWQCHVATNDFARMACRPPDCICMLSTSHVVKRLIINDRTVAVHVLQHAFVSQATHRMQEVDKVEDEGISRDHFCV